VSTAQLRIAPFTSALMLLLALAGCSERGDEHEKKSLYPKVHEQMLREQDEQARRSVGKRPVMSEKTRKKLLTEAAGCDQRYSRCMERCESSSCEDTCMKSLEACEKNLPVELKTVK